MSILLEHGGSTCNPPPTEHLCLFVKTREYLILPKGYFANRSEETR